MTRTIHPQEPQPVPIAGKGREGRGREWEETPGGGEEMATWDVFPRREGTFTTVGKGRGRSRLGSQKPQNTSGLIMMWMHVQGGSADVSVGWWYQGDQLRAVGRDDLGGSVPDSRQHALRELARLQ